MSDLIERLDFTIEHGVLIASTSGMLAELSECKIQLEAQQAEISWLKVDNLALSERCKKRDRQIAKLAGALESAPPINLDAGSWWYPEGDTSSEACCQSAYEVAEHVACDMRDGEKRVIVVERALELPDVFGLIHVLTAAEMEARDDDEEWTLSLHATKEDACLARKELEQKP